MINNDELVEFLMSKGHRYLYHANSVSTWATFLENKRLLSRKYISDNGLWQTYQPSDSKDKDPDIDVFDDIFLDLFDIHNTFHKKNDYGPVLGEFDINSIRDSAYDIFIIKNNPIYLTKIEYFTDISEYIEAYDASDIIGKIRMMITIRKPKYGFSLAGLHTLILDDPLIECNEYGHTYTFYSRAKDHLEKCCQSIVAINPRSCIKKCSCIENYKEDLRDTAFKFFEKDALIRKLHYDYPK